MELKEALTFVFDLAQDNALTEDDVKQDAEILQDQYNMQQEALDVVLDFIKKLRIT